MRRFFMKWMAVAAIWTLSAQLWAVNEKQNVAQVTGTTEVTGDVDFTVTGATPFATDGIVNIVNTDHAVIILEQVKPSSAKSLLAKHVQIAGAKAIDGTNCQVKLYNRGSIILPYGNSFKPLTVYSEKRFGGESVNNFGLGNDGGFMNTLTDEQLNNRIRSFKLKRGYMVTFSIKAKGRGYSRCFIADDADLEMDSLPGILDRSITSYRIFKWYDTGKQAIANDTRAEVVNALNVTSCYSFGLGETRLPDAECVPHHIYEDWPSASACGQVTYSPHLKTNNEPRNTADDHPQDLETILNNWENLMATGMRLCSPSSWDGSDYWNGTGFLKSFFDEIDKRGWRCDICDLHGYWNEGSFGTNVPNWFNAVKRPIWISEWVWGASWSGGSGIFAVASSKDNPTAADLQKNKEAVQRICNTLNGLSYVERYYYWNSEANCSKLYYGGKLTPAGEMYAKINSGLGFKKSNLYVPKAPPQTAPADLGIVYDADSGTATLSWTESNGEMNEYIYVQCRHGSSAAWEDVVEVPLTEEVGIYTVSGVSAQDGWEFRIKEKNARGVTQYTNIVMAVNNEVKAGNAINIGDETFYVGGNIILNGKFDMGLSGWVNGKGEPLAYPWFQTPAIGGPDGSSYLQCYGNGGMNTESAVKTVFKIEPNTNYYFVASACNMNTGSLARVLLSENGTTGSTAATLNNTLAPWLSSFKTFNSKDNDYAIISLVTLGAKSRFDNITLCRLFADRDEALADGAEKERQRAQAFMDYNPLFNTVLASQLAIVKDDKGEDADDVRRMTDDAIRAAAVLPLLKARTQEAKAIVSRYPIIGSESLEAIISEVEAKADDDVTPQWVLEVYQSLTDTMDDCLTLTPKEGLVKQPKFVNATGWNTKAGTYTGGDQRVTTFDGITCWNAWWSLDPADAAGMTLAVSQDVTKLQEHGLYFLSCRAATEHYCLSDQHAYIRQGTTTSVSPTLTHDYLDLTNIDISNRWQTLTTLPVYVDYNGSVTIGFESSKEGVTDMAFRPVGTANGSGDHREGWWCATDFTLRHLPYYETSVTANQWQTACLPYNVTASPKMKFYQIAGILSDYSALCLEEVEEVAAGEPFMYMPEEDMAKFREYGEAINTANTKGNGNLRGYFNTTAKAPETYYSLVDGVWQKPTDGVRVPIGNYHAIMRPLTDKNSLPFTIYESWSGATVPIMGISDEEKAILSTIDQTEMTVPQKVRYYTTSGLPIEQQSRLGVYIKVENGKATKIIIR